VRSTNDAQRAASLSRIVGHQFRDVSLAVQALTHPSAVEADIARSYQRLEYLGDSIVGFTVAKYIYSTYPALDEGTMSKMRIAAVNGLTLAAVSADLGFGDLIRFGSSELTEESRGMLSALGDVFESVTAALYLDAGLEVAEPWVLECLKPYIKPEVQEMSSPKSDLQERVQANGLSIHYEIVDRCGPPHAPLFTAEVHIGGTPMGSGSGTSKKAAESAAAEEALSRIEAEDAW